MDKWSNGHDLYHPDLLKYAAEHPRMQKDHSAEFIIKAYNSLCGDKYELRFDVDEGLITNTSFYGYGCVISKASTGLLAETLPGKTLEKALDEIRLYLAGFAGDPGVDQKSPYFRHLKVSRKYPGRIQCATLTWEATRDSKIFDL